MNGAGGTGSRREHLLAVGIAMAVLVLVVGLIAAVGANDGDGNSVVAGAPVVAANAAEVSDAGADAGAGVTSGSGDATDTTMGAMEHDHASGATGATTSDHDAEHAPSDTTGGEHDAEHAHDDATTANAAATGEHNHDGATATPGSTDAGAHEHDHATDTTQPGSPPTTAHAHEHDPETPTGPIISLDDPRLTASQRAAAQSLIDRTKAGLAKYPTPLSVKNDGYVHIGDGGNGFEHWIREDYMNDGAELDANRIESIVIQRNGNGTRTVASAMYILNEGKTMADVPEIAGSLTTWHIHDNLCFIGTHLSGVLVNGKCTPGGTLRITPPMLHVWIVPHDCGPFAGLEGAGGDCAAHSH